MSTSSVKAAQSPPKRRQVRAKRPSRPPGPSPAVMGTYARQNIAFERGEGAWLIIDNRRAAISISPAASPSTRSVTPTPS